VAEGRAVGVIPARLAATRLPRKPLADIAGRPMIRWVWERASAAELLDEVIVATPDEEIVSACASFGARAVLTAPEHPTGTDRVAEAAAGLEAELVVNIQGDEPLIRGEDLDALVSAMRSDGDAALGSLMFPLAEEEDASDPNLVKVVVDRCGRALYFSRSCIPYDRTGARPARFGHIGVYAWRRDRLLEFARMERGRLEEAESLEQLRALEAGWKIRMVPTDFRPVGVDTPADLERARRALGA